MGNIEDVLFSCVHYLRILWCDRFPASSSFSFIHVVVVWASLLGSSVSCTKALGLAVSLDR